MRGGKKMNEFYEAVSNLFEELRCDSGEREYTVQPEEWKEAEKNLKQIQKKLPLHLEKSQSVSRISGINIWIS